MLLQARSDCWLRAHYFVLSLLLTAVDSWQAVAGRTHDGRNSKSRCGAQLTAGALEQADLQLWRCGASGASVTALTRLEWLGKVP